MIVGWVAKSAFQGESYDEAVDLGAQYVPTHPFLCRHGHPSHNGSGGYVAQGTGGRNATVQHGTIGGIPHFHKQPCVSMCNEQFSSTMIRETSIPSHQLLVSDTRRLVQN